MSKCEQLEEFLTTADGASRRTPPDSIRAHLEKCAPCRKIWEFLCSGDAPEAPKDVCGRIEQRLKSSLTPVKPLPCRATRAAGFLAIFFAGAGLFVFQTGWGGAQGMTAVQLAGTLSAVAAAAALAAVVLSDEMVPGEKRLGSIGLMALLAVGGIALLVTAVFPWEAAGPSWLTAAMKCHTHGAMIALPTAAAALLLFRRGAVLCPGTAGAAIGLLAGLASMATLHLGCTMHSALHITVGHLSLPAGGALIGYLTGKAVARWSRARRSAQA